MAQRLRVEDLGIIAEKLDRATTDFSKHISSYMGSNYFVEKMRDADNAETLFEQLCYLRTELIEIWQLARYGEEDGCED